MSFQRVLVIGYVWPEPTSSAAGGHMMQLLQCFTTQGWHVTFASPARVGEHKADLAALGIAERAIELNDDSFDRFVAELQPDMVLFDRFMMEEQFGWRVEQHCPQAVRVLETCDLQSLRDARQGLLKQRLHASDDENDFSALFAEAPDTLYAHMSDADITQREVAAIFRCDLSLMISPFETQLLTERFGVPASLLHDCPLMVEPPATAALTFEQRANFVCIGNFRHAPNWDAVLWLKQQVWPRIRKQLPRAQLHVHGAYTPPKATALHNPAQGFLVKGWAMDALQVVGQARVALAPLRFGAGIKGKLLDAMLCGTPSVTTPTGAEGMRTGERWPGRIGRSADELARAAVELYENADQWQAAHEQCHEHLGVQYATEPHAQALILRLQQLSQNLAQHRRANFTGSMLRHHLHKSTKYFSQWIQSKNQSV
ncbi:glycosyltransferase family 4 protein [Pseudomonas sp. CFBP 8758]|uniref:glycosyltransferase n=1 Tax=Pseudomonas sp. CFBP 8758 TaxID=2775286 RepID=UPI00177DAB03|nr:glycosyltransferase [Pseudomonas sp. CFBP 8758]MBD8595515.1 glycosyltransferase family 4 protein [Pseudomonas sp. CFBP 8758]